jgi:hypothetical protein
VVIPIPDDIDAQEAPDRALILDFDVLLQFFIYCITLFFCWTNHLNIIDIDCEKDVPSNMNAGIRFQRHKPEF